MSVLSPVQNIPEDGLSDSSETPVVMLSVVSSVANGVGFFQDPEAYSFLLRIRTFRRMPPFQQRLQHLSRFVKRFSRAPSNAFGCHVNTLDDFVDGSSVFACVLN